MRKNRESETQEKNLDSDNLYLPVQCPKDKLVLNKSAAVTIRAQKLDDSDKLIFLIHCSKDKCIQIFFAHSGLN